jgi:hypothetical protein
VRETLALWDLAKLADRQRELAAHATTTISEE